jgi:hypothetical protein
MAALLQTGPMAQDLVRFEGWRCGSRPRRKERHPPQFQKHDPLLRSCVSSSGARAPADPRALARCDHAGFRALGGRRPTQQRHSAAATAASTVADHRFRDLVNSRASQGDMGAYARLIRQKHLGPYERGALIPNEIYIEGRYQRSDRMYPYIPRHMLIVQMWRRSPCSSLGSR